MKQSNGISCTVGDFRFNPLAKRYIQEIVKSNRLSYGPFSQKFEAEFAKAHDCKYAIFCNSGTSALHIAIAALKEKYGWEDGSEVLVPAITFVATVNTVLHNRLKPVLVDVDQYTYDINPDLIKSAITPKTVAIIPVHLTGLPAEMICILQIAKRYKLKIIEDSCETLFANCHGKKVGSWGDIGCFSTYMAHYIVTGIGGIATTNNPDLAVRLRSLMNHGRDSIYLNIDDDKKFNTELIAKRFKFQSIGHSFRATEFEAALGVAQMSEKDTIISDRKKNAEYLKSGLMELHPILQLPLEPFDREHMFMMFPIVLKSGDKQQLVNYLEAHGIETRDLLPLTNQPCYKNLFNSDNYKIADWLNHQAFYIGCHQYMTRRQLDHIIQTFKNYFIAKNMLMSR